MKWSVLLLLLALLPGCAHLGVRDGDDRARATLWERAHDALSAGNYQLAEQQFEALATEHAATQEGREALFYLGGLRLDPRNPAWDPRPAEDALARYLAQDSLSHDGVERAPEGHILLELARQLNLPPGARVPGLQPEPRVVTRVERPRVVATGREIRELQTEVDRLRAQVADRDAEIRRQREELERIRKTLAPRRAG